MTKMLKILCRAQNVVYNVVSISGSELVGNAVISAATTSNVATKVT